MVQLLIRLLRNLRSERTTTALMALSAFYCGFGKDEFTPLKYLHDLGTFPFAGTLCELKRNGPVCGAKGTSVSENVVKEMHA